MKSLIVATLALAATPSFACIQDVVRTELVEVVRDVKSVKVQTGDVIAIPVTHSINPANFEKDADIKVNQSIAQVIGEVALTPKKVVPVGVGGSRYLFAVTGAGKTTLKLKITNKNGDVLKNVTLKIESTERPVPRCM